MHASNFHVTGFTSAVPVAELAKLGVPLVVDIGSGLLTPHPLLPEEPHATTVLHDGADLVSASGDKLLGGPQAGLLFGDAGLIERLRRHPAARALRVDKLTLAALKATLVGPSPPVVERLNADVAELRRRAERLAAQLPDANAVDCIAAVGGGGAPGVELPSAGGSLPESYAARCAPAASRSSGAWKAGRACWTAHGRTGRRRAAAAGGARVFVVATAGIPDAPVVLGTDLDAVRSQLAVSWISCRRLTAPPTCACGSTVRSPCAACRHSAETRPWSARSHASR